MFIHGVEQWLNDCLWSVAYTCRLHCAMLSCTWTTCTGEHHCSVARHVLQGKLCDISLHHLKITSSGYIIRLHHQVTSSDYVTRLLLMFITSWWSRLYQRESNIASNFSVVTVVKLRGEKGPSPFQVDVCYALPTSTPTTSKCFQECLIFVQLCSSGLLGNERRNFELRGDLV